MLFDGAHGGMQVIAVALTLVLGAAHQVPAAQCLVDRGTQLVADVVASWPDLRRPVPFEGYLLFGDVSLRNNRLASLPLPYPGAGGAHFELGFIEGELVEETDLTEPVARLFAPEVAMKRKRVKDADALALLDLLERRYRVTPF